MPHIDFGQRGQKGIGPTHQRPWVGPTRRQLSGAGDSPAATPERGRGLGRWLDFAYRQPFRARPGPFERADDDESNYGGGRVGLDRNHRRPQAVAAVVFGPRSKRGRSGLGVRLGLRLGAARVLEHASDLRRGSGARTTRGRRPWRAAEFTSAGTATEHIRA